LALIAFSIAAGGGGDFGAEWKWIGRARARGIIKPLVGGADDVGRT